MRTRRAIIANTPLARALVQRRQRDHLTLREASEASGVHYATIHRLERSAALPTVRVALALAHWLEIPLPDLFGGTPR